MKYLFLFLVMLPLFVNAQNLYPNIPTNIATINTFGYWIDGEVDGYYRIIIIKNGYEHIKNEVYIQKIKSPESMESDDEIIANISINEINEPNLYVIDDFEIKEVMNMPQIFIQLINSYDLSKSSLNIQLEENFYKVIDY